MKIVKYIIIDNSLEIFVDKIFIDDVTVPFARYFYKDKVLSFNYDNIIKTIFYYSSTYFDNITDLIEYINLNFLIIVNHEIEHIIQEKNVNELFLYTVSYEEFLKRKNKYYAEKFFNNPLERQANIYSLNSLLKDVNIYSLRCKLMIESKLKYTLQYGYSYNSFPVLLFFDDVDIYDKSIEWSNEYKNDKLEYGLELDDLELFKLKRNIYNK